jgi:hypothetical protein
VLHQIQTTLDTLSGKDTAMPFELPQSIQLFQEKFGQIVADLDMLVARFLSASSDVDRNGYPKVPRLAWSREMTKIPLIQARIRECREFLVACFSTLSVFQGFACAPKTCGENMSADLS